MPADSFFVASSSFFSRKAVCNHWVSFFLVHRKLGLIGIIPGFDPMGGAALCFFISPSCQFFYRCRRIRKNLFFARPFSIGLCLECMYRQRYCNSDRDWSVLLSLFSLVVLPLTVTPILRCILPDWLKTSFYRSLPGSVQKLTTSTNTLDSSMTSVVRRDRYTCYNLHSIVFWIKRRQIQSQGSSNSISTCVYRQSWFFFFAWMSLWDVMLKLCTNCDLPHLFTINKLTKKCNIFLYCHQRHTACATGLSTNQNPSWTTRQKDYVHYRSSSLRLPEATSTPTAGSAPGANSALTIKYQDTEQSESRGQTTKIWEAREREQQQNRGRPTCAMCMRIAQVGGWATTRQCKEEKDDLLCTCAA